MAVKFACPRRRVSRNALFTLLVLMASLYDAEAFGCVGGVGGMRRSSILRMTEDVNGDTLAELGPGEADELDDLLSKRVPVAVRYSGDSGLKPYFLTVAKKIKDTHPDVLLERVILPKVVLDQESIPTFEVLVDGRVVIPTLGKKEGPMSDVIFVSMQELELAISKARRRRRPTTVYGEEEPNVRLEILKAKAAATAAPNTND